VTRKLPESHFDELPRPIKAAASAEGECPASGVTFCKLIKGADLADRMRFLKLLTQLMDGDTRCWAMYVNGLVMIKV
jgi:hypothetical protein